MISELALTNFKGFSGCHTVPLSPVTLIFGPNSAGKSAIIQSLVLLKQSFPDGWRLDRRRPPLTLGGDTLDLGGFRNVINRFASEPTLGLSVTVKPSSDRTPSGPDRLQGVASGTYGLTVSWDSEVEALQPSAANVSLTGIVGSVHYVVDLSIVDPEFKSSQVSREGAHWESQGVMTLENLEQLLQWAEQSNHFGNGDLATLGDAQRAMIRGDTSFQRLSIPIEWLGAVPHARLKNRRVSTTELLEVDLALSLNQELHDLGLGEIDLGMNEEELKSLQLDVACSRVRQYLAQTTSLIMGEFSRAAYIGPIRKVPQRLEDIQNASPYGMAPNGEGITAALRRDRSLLEHVNVMLHQLEVPYSISVANIWNADHPTAGEYLALQLTDKRSGAVVSPQDVGYGVSQLLPIVLHTQLMKRSILLVEQPEVHLHPRLQADLAEVLALKAVRTKSQVILESHSENMLLRIQRLVREHQIPAEDVRIVFVSSQPGSGSRIQSIGLDADGDFLEQWPDGFFELRLSEY